ncbi:MAG TPA: paraquat-inducible protein A [Leucothrix mucor]|nr:paraquat-inducible protein A [Leucothrix mucor]
MSIMSSNQATQQVTSQHPTFTRMACPDCDLLQTLPMLSINESAKCIRCDATLFKNKKNSVDRSLAFAITGLILFVLANLFPLISLKAMGVTQDGTLLSTAVSLVQAERPLLGILIFLTTIFFPAFTLIGTITILIQVKTDRLNTMTAPLFRFLHSTDAWSMLEIFMLAVLVAVVKLGDLADVIFGISLFAFCLLILALTLLSYSLNPHDVWNKLRDSEGCRI